MTWKRSASVWPSQSWVPEEDISRSEAAGPFDDGYLDLAGGRVSQTFSILSLLPPTIRFPSGLKHTLPIPSECPLRVSVSWSVPASQILIVRSALAEASRLPFGLKVTAEMNDSSCV